MKNKIIKLPNEYNESELYREKIIELINEIEGVGTLEYLYTFIKLFKEKWG